MPGFIKNPLEGILGAKTASFYRLDPTGTIPIEPVADLRPAFTPNRVTLDMVDAEDLSRSYQVTTNALQDFTSATSNVHRDLIRLTVSGTLISSVDLPFIGSVGFAGLRADLLKISNLETIADRREPIMVVTPRVSLAKAFIESVSRSWTPDLGENTLVTVSLVEARIVNPLSADAAVPDVAGSNTGNNAVVGAGAQSPAPVVTQSIIPGPVFGAAPNVVPFA
jgi:hypothetical protein